MFRLIPLIVLVVLMQSSPVRAQGRFMEYAVDGKTHEAYVAVPKGKTGASPVVVVVHDWRGRSDFNNRFADGIAAQGYVGFAADMFGKGVLATTPEAALAQIKPFLADRMLLRSRIQAVIEAAKGLPEVDPTRVVVMGFCFGGTTALEAARAGLASSGALSLHGNLSAPAHADPTGLKTPILVLHGAEDPSVPDAQALDFFKEMRGAKADWRMVFFGGAEHSFTNPEAHGDRPGHRYDPKADARARRLVNDFLTEVFAGGKP